MPFRSVHVSVDPKTPECVYTAAAGDVEVQIRSQGYGGINSSNGYTFSVGGPELADDQNVGLACFSGEFGTSVEEGDEIWVATEPVAFGPVTPLTILVRSARRKDGGGDEGPPADAE